MRAHYLLPLIVAFAVPSLGAAQQTPAPAASQPAPPPAQATAPKRKVQDADANKQVCVTVRDLGSRVRQQVCKTQKQIEADRRSAASTLVENSEPRRTDSATGIGPGVAPASPGGGAR